MAEKPSNACCKCLARLLFVLLPAVVGTLYLAGPHGPYSVKFLGVSVTGHYVFHATPPAVAHSVRWDYWWNRPGAARTMLLLADPYRETFLSFQWLSAGDTHDPDEWNTWAISPDGRYAAHWVGSRLTLIDLEWLRVVASREVDLRAFREEPNAWLGPPEPTIRFGRPAEVTLIKATLLTGNRQELQVGTYRVPDLQPVPPLDDPDSPSFVWSANGTELRRRHAVRLRSIVRNEERRGDFYEEEERRKVWEPLLDQSSPYEPQAGEELAIRPYRVLGVSPSGQHLVLYNPVVRRTYILNREIRKLVALETDVKTDADSNMAADMATYLPLVRHESQVKFSRTGENLWVVLHDHLIACYAPDTGKPRFTIKPLSAVLSMAVSPDGEQVVFDSTDDIFKFRSGEKKFLGWFDTDAMVTGLEQRNWRFRMWVYGLAVAWTFVWLVVRWQSGYPVFVPVRCC